ncbi:MAG: hypothetical protein ABSG19_12500 [Candidatus Aminicenantales bacterium]
MRKRVCLFVTIILWGQAGQIGAETIKLVRTDVVIDFKEEGFYKSIPFIALQEDLFFITDNFTHRVLEYRFRRNRLEFLRAIGRPGQGPGDLMLPTDISISADILAVKDESGISFFGLDGGFKNKFPLLSRAGTMMFAGEEIYTATYDVAKPDLIHVYSRKGEWLRSFQNKRSLYPIRYDIHKGLSPDGVEQIVFDGLLRRDGQSVYFLSKRFGNVLRFSPNGKETGNWELSRILGKSEKAKAEENRRMFLDEGFDLMKNERMIPNYYLFEDAQLVDTRLYLLLQNYDLVAKNVKPVIEFVEIDLDALAVVGTFRADAQAKWESALRFVFIGDKSNPIFLTTVHDPGEDDKLCIFRTEANIK